MDTYILDEKRSLNGRAQKIQYQINENNCHICISHCLNTSGYPVVNRDKKEWRMSRYIWTIHNGEIANNLVVCHKCDNPACINIEHLFLGSHDENMQDKVRKNRQAKFSKLTADDVIKIKTNVSNTAKELAEEFGISHGTIDAIWTERIYYYVEIKNYNEIKKERRERSLNKIINNLKPRGGFKEERHSTPSK